MTLGLCKKGLGGSLRGPSLGQATYIKPVSESLRSPSPACPGSELGLESLVIRVRNFILLDTTLDPSNLI